MTDFYQQLLSSAPVDVALRKAKINYLEEADELTADPIIWAPLVVYGDSDPIVNNKRTNIILLISAAILILVLLFLWKKNPR